jgi:hypothetical protein
MHAPTSFVKELRQMPTIQLRVSNIVELPPFLHVVEIKSWAKILMGPIKSRPIGMLHLCVGRGGAPVGSLLSRNGHVLRRWLFDRVFDGVLLTK